MTLPTGFSPPEKGFTVSKALRYLNRRGAR